MEFVRLLVTQNPGELALVKSLLEANKIEYSVQNEHFGALYNLPVLPYVVMVRKTHLSRAQTLLSLLESQEDGRRDEQRGRVVNLPLHRHSGY